MNMDLCDATDQGELQLLALRRTAASRERS